MHSNTYQVTINDSYEIELSNEEAASLDSVRMPDGQYHVLLKGKSFNAKVELLDFEKKTIRLLINGNPYEVKLKDHFDLLVKKMGLSTTIIHKIKDVKAPMPGLVLDIAVQEGQEVIHGDPLLILEAMKMENIIKSPGEGRIRNVLVSKGQAVEKGQMLIELE